MQSEPLIVIDGIVRDYDAFNMPTRTMWENVNVLVTLATAVYGVRGANGVIIVTTRAAAKAARKSVHGQCRLSPPRTTLPSLVNSYDYAVLRNEAFANDGKPGRHQGLFAGRTVEIPA